MVSYGTFIVKCGNCAKGSESYFISCNLCGTGKQLNMIKLDNDNKIFATICSSCIKYKRQEEPMKKEVQQIQIKKKEKHIEKKKPINRFDLLEEIQC